MTNPELRVVILKARTIAQPHGSMHGMWDAIFDAEAILKGEPSILARSDIERILVEFVKA